MPEKFICNKSTEELQKIYDEVGTIKAMCPIVGCKSDITMRKILHERGIDTNKNQKKKNKTMLGLTDEQFELFLRNEYEMLSMGDIALELGVTHSVISKFFKKYGIAPRNHTLRSPLKHMEMEQRRYFYDNDYVRIYRPDHPRARNGYIREHVYIMEQHIGRYLHPGEEVHHIDLNKHNNDISNLAILSKSQHMKVHYKIRHGIDKFQALKEVMNNAQ